MQYRRLVTILVAILIVCGGGILTANPIVEHVVMLPFVEGSGITASIFTLTQAETTVSKAAAISNITALGVTATLGIMTMVMPAEARYPMLIIHRVLGAVTTGLSIWLAVSNSIDDGTRGQVSQGLACTYSALTGFPLLMFRY